MKEKLVRRLMLMGLLVLGVLALRGHRVLASEFDSNFENVTEKVTPEKEAKFIENDKEYLNTEHPIDELEQEIEVLEEELSSVKNDYIKTNNNVKIYTGNTALKNNALRTAIINRKGLISSGKSFKYDDRARYTIGREFIKEHQVRKVFTQKQIDQSLVLVKEVIENLEMNCEFLRDTIFVISPYMIDGANGYTLTKDSGNSLVVVSGQDLKAPDNFIERSIKSTVLHEIGHVFLNKKHASLKQHNLKIESYVTARADNLNQWEKSTRENFAEDFRIFASGKLGSKSFKPMKKKTTIKTDQKKFADIMEKVLI